MRDHGGECEESDLEALEAVAVKVLADGVEGGDDDGEEHVDHDEVDQLG